MADRCSNCSISATNCTSCVSASGIPFLDGNVCVDACPDDEFPLNGVCQPCSPICGTCIGSADNCLTCEQPRPFKVNGNSCTNECPDDTFLSGDECFDCSGNCATCDGPDSDDCLSCNGTFSLLLGSQCVGQCPGGTVAVGGTTCVSCNPVCSTCSESPDRCVTCSFQYPLKYQTTCVVVCPAGSFEVVGENRCQVSSASVSPTISPSPSSTKSLTRTPSISTTRTATPVIPSTSQSPSPSRFGSPSPSASLYFPTNLPFFVQPAGAATGQFIIQLRSIRTSFGDGIKRELQTIIATMMDIPLQDVIVVRVSDFQQATVIICAGDFAGFFNSLNRRDPIFDGTVLEAAYSQYAFWDVPCVDPLSILPDLPEDDGASPADPTYSYIDFSTFRPPIRNDSPDSPESPRALAPSSAYVTDSLLILGDDDEFIIVKVNDATTIQAPLFLLVALLTLLIIV